MNRKQVMILITSGTIAIGLGLVGYGIYTIQKGLASKNWPAVHGEIVSAEIESIERHTDNGTNTFYQLRISYRYEVGEQTYLGDELRISSPVVYLESELHEAKAHLSKYRVGANVLVLYHPENPMQATLETGYNKRLWFFIGGGIFFCVVAIGIYRFEKNQIYY